MYIVICFIVLVIFSTIASIKTIKILSNKLDEFIWISFSIIIPNLLIVIFVYFYKNNSGGTWTEFEGPIYGLLLFFLYCLVNYFVQKAKFKNIQQKKQKLDHNVIKGSNALKGWLS